MTAALVIGKFYPPHPGHLHLLRTALGLRREAVLLCLGSVVDTYSPAQRLTALLDDAAAAGLHTNRLTARAGFDEAPFDLDSPTVWASHIEAFRAHLTGLPPVDLVVTSEGYGLELADRLGVGHAACDPGRATVPLAATGIRSDPLSNWHTLGPGTRRMLTSRIVLLGAESTGTTTVAECLADRLRERGGPWSQTRLVAEYGRALTEEKQKAAGHSKRPLSVTWTPEDFAEVASVQSRLEDQAAGIGGPALICDTDAFTTPVWERRYLGADHGHLDAARLGAADVYLLTSHEGVPFVQDGTRDGEHLREQMTLDFLTHLVTHNKPFAVLTGSLAERVALAERVTDQTVRRRLTLSDPI